MEFYAECVRRAFRGRLLLAEGIAGILGVVAIPVGIEFPDIFGQSSWLPLYIFGTVFVLIVLIGLIKAPRDMHLEALAEIGRLSLVIEDKEAWQKALNELWSLRKAGVELRNKSITEEEFIAWCAEFKEWHDNVYQQARIISKNLEQWLRTLDQVVQGPIAPYIHENHKQHLRIFSEILFRLQLFLEKDLKWPKVGT